MATKEYDVLVIGGGPGGYTAAIRAAQLGLNVALAERDDLGGVCLNWGCIPTKTLLHSADLLREMRGAETLGLKVGKPGFDLDRMVARSREVAAQLSGGISHLMRKNKITVLKGEAVFIDKNTVQVAEETVQADNVIIATGARARSLPTISFDDLVWDARAAMTPTFLPKRLLIIGAGAIGIEFASFYATLGSKVTIVEVAGQILPVEDAEIASLATSAFTAQGITVHTGTAIDALNRKGSTLTATIDGETQKFEAAILSVGVAGNIETLGLDNADVQVDRGFITTDNNCQTPTAGIYAIGDVAGAPCLAHKASFEAIIAAETIAGQIPHALHPDRIPGCTYSHPQIASIGLTEQQATAAGRETRIGRFPLLANGKAIAINDSEGLVKTIFDRDTGELLGAHMIGAGVTELIQGFAIAIGLETTEAELMATIFPHPTLSEAMHESVLSAYDQTINF